MTKPVRGCPPSGYRNVPSEVILFGSYARGTADEGSDLDLLVIEREIPNKADEYMRLREADR